MRESQDVKGRTLDELSYSGERELVESTSSRKTGAFWEDQQAAERVRCRYLHSTNGYKPGTSVFEIGKSRKTLRRRASP